MVKRNFEKFIRSTKRCLCKVIKKARFSYNKLSTTFIEVEDNTNFQPLPYLSLDDLEEPLTPTHLLTGCRTLSLPDHLCHASDEEVSDVEIISLLKE